MYQPTLAAAALVCTTWYPRAMRNLYYSLEIRSRTSLNMLFKQCRASPRVKQWLASTYKLVADEAYYDSDSDSSEDEDGSMESPQRGNKSNSYNHSPQTLPSALAGLMPRLRSLYVGEGGLRFICTDFFLALSKYKSVKSLTLQSCELNNVRQLRRIVCAFPQLTDLTIDVELAQRGAASHAGASLSQLPPHMRLRYLDVVVHEELMAMSVDWMAHSNLCTSLADLTFWSNHPPMARTCLNNLLETAGASLTRFCERYSNNDDRVHGNLSQNAACDPWTSCYITSNTRPKTSGLARRGLKQRTSCTASSAPFEAASSSTLRSASRFTSTTALSRLSSPGCPRELDLRDLHEVMRQPYFDTLRSVEVKMYLCPHILQASISQKLKPMFHGILQPWSALA
ncbi:uncharacterized protein B0H18DRAFT_1212897 [Fomitopsis serialis]|uniref:uncharacterized protein n=1 Tax=Fomitopsis serialis TaxID=139415 RepID=UPI0020089A05|nr:uncharacterized protein B0H18DRAFT_1212897 [Neoantrodia serialis]KAH9921813.1 hypothetical protein B0H18DRAFT_1212897 [Neoantrodia serialis]